MLNYCTDCGKEISDRSIRCWNCHVKNPNKRQNTLKWRQEQSKRITTYHDKRGRVPSDRCIDCKREITQGATRCQSCYHIYQQTLKFRQLQAEETRKSWDKRGRNSKNYCVDCNKEIGQGAIRCKHCAPKARTGWKHTEETLQKLRDFHSGKILTAEHRNKIGLGNTNPSEEILRRRSVSLKEAHRRGCFDSEETRLKSSKSIKEAWKRGDYDGIFQSPTQPELDLIAVLEELEVNYQSQYRIETYPYDVYLPDYNVLIEYDGWWWHYSDWAIEHGFAERDAIKDKLAKETGMDLIRLKGLSTHDLTKEEMKKLLEKELDLNEYI